jgi:hypothetical protein
MIRLVPIPTITGTLSLRQFEKQLDELSNNGYKVVCVASDLVFLEKPDEDDSNG